MITHKTRLRWRRRLRKSKKQVIEAGSETEVRLERYFFRRMTRLINVRRFMASWITLVLVIMVGLFVQTRQLIPYYQEVQATSGGTYREGILGVFTNANPLYASGSVDGAVSRLLFSGLFTYDEFNQITGDLAESVDIDETETVYTVTLREGINWHDGTPFTSADVVFTYQTIANPDARSPLFSSWKDTKVEAIDERTVRFTLPNSFTSFMASLTNGIVPKHILEDVPPSQLRSSIFNTAQPVGTGPFQWETIEVSGGAVEERQERIAVTAYAGYHFGPPQIERFIVRTYRNEDQMVKDFEAKDIIGMAGVDTFDAESLIESEHYTYNIPLTGQVGVFFNTSRDIFSSKQVRQALVRAINTTDVRSEFKVSVPPSNSPLLPIHQGYDPELVQLSFDAEKANELLTEAEWVRDEDGIRTKDNEPLEFSLVALNSADARVAARSLQEQWHQVGVRVDVTYQSEDELQASIAQHEYDALLHGISIGVDPDVFAYWHSSQADVLADNRLNLSEYKSSVADDALEAGRTRSDDELRSAKYQPFLRAWRDDAPALMLYQPQFLYVTNTQIEGFNPLIMNSGNERMNTVHEWLIRRVRLDK